MKVLFDCIVTATPSKCSTTVQFVTLAKMLLGQGSTFIYWPIPDYLTEEERASYPQDAHIRYMDIPQSKDRMKEYNRINPVLEDIVSFNGETWDWDVMVTVRSTQIPMMRVLCTGPRQKNRTWTKRIVLIEDMMISSKKPTVALSNPDVQDRLTCEAYLAADKTLIPAYHEKRWVKEMAKVHFSPSKVKEMLGKIHEVCHLNMPEYKLKRKFKYKGDRRLGVAFVGRLEKFGVRLDDMNDTLLKQFIMRKTEIRPFVCTVTQGRKGFKCQDIEVLHPKRDEFWRICREEMDVAISMSIDVELSMSKLEPIALGVPLIVVKAPWSVGMLGEDYPFFIKSPTEMYSMVTMFLKDYNKMYTKFSKWFKDWFIPVYTHRIANDGMYTLLMETILKEPEDPHGSLDSMRDNTIIKLIAENAGEDFILFELLRKLGETDLKTLADKLEPGDRERRGLVWSTPWNDFRLALKRFYGYEDASVVTGHLKKV